MAEPYNSSIIRLSNVANDLLRQHDGLLGCNPSMIRRDGNNNSSSRFDDCNNRHELLQEITNQPNEALRLGKRQLRNEDLDINEDEDDNNPLSSSEVLYTLPHRHTNKICIPTDNHKSKKNQPSNNAWADIFCKCKLVLQGHLNKTNNSLELYGDIDIAFFDQNFETCFGYAMKPTQNMFDSRDTFTLTQLIGAASPPTAYRIMEESLFTGKPRSLYVNLYTEKGNILSCHVSLTPLSKASGEGTLRDNCVASDDSELYSLPISTASIDTSRERKYMQCCWGLLTIRSASVVGSASSLGIGFFGLHQTTESALALALDAVYGERK